jgi:hypothetical protein
MPDATTWAPGCPQVNIGDMVQYGPDYELRGTVTAFPTRLNTLGEICEIEVSNTIIGGRRCIQRWNVLLRTNWPSRVGAADETTTAEPVPLTEEEMAALPPRTPVKVLATRWPHPEQLGKEGISLGPHIAPGPLGLTVLMPTGLVLIATKVALVDQQPVNSAVEATEALNRRPVEEDWQAKYQEAISLAAGKEKELEAFRQKVVDVGYRAAEENAMCGVFEEVLAELDLGQLKRNASVRGTFSGTAQIKGRFEDMSTEQIGEWIKATIDAGDWEFEADS